MNPASPNLANLKKRAKTVLRQHASRHVPVADRIRRALPAFAGRSDRQVLAAKLTLAQAQEVIARELSFAGWAQLKRSIEAMPATERSPAPESAPEILSVQPQAFVTDLERAVAFYRDKLGFTVGYVYGEPPFYGLVKRGAAGLNLRHVDASPWRDGERTRDDLVAASFVVRNAKALFVEFKTAGVPFHQPYREQPWGAHDFIVLDPDGNLIHFASEVGEV